MGKSVIFLWGERCGGHALPLPATHRLGPPPRSAAALRLATRPRPIPLHSRAVLGALPCVMTGRPPCFVRQANRGNLYVSCIPLVQLPYRTSNTKGHIEGLSYKHSILFFYRVLVDRVLLLAYHHVTCSSSASNQLGVCDMEFFYVLWAAIVVVFLYPF